MVDFLTDGPASQSQKSAPPASQGDHVRIGPLSLFALIIVICLAVLSVLAFSSANASLVMSQRQATATVELYLDETAAQEFLAGVDDVLATVRGEADGDAGKADGADEGDIQLVYDERGNLKYDKFGNPVVEEVDEAASTIGQRGAEAVDDALLDLVDRAEAAVDGKVDALASVNGNKVNAWFTCENGRTLNILVTIRNNGTYRIDRWKMSAVQNEEPPQGKLWTGE